MKFPIALESLIAEEKDFFQIIVQCSSFDILVQM